jgi:hypothetical protein
MEYGKDRLNAEIRALKEENEKLKEALVSAKGGRTQVSTPDASPSIDMVNHPPHYQMPGGIETIDYIEAVLGQDYFKTVPGIVAHGVGCSLKYLSRPGKGKFSQDLRKSVWYANRAIEALEKIGE